MAGKKFGKSILSEDGTLKIDFMTSLQNIVMAKIVSNLWMKKSTIQDIVNLIHSGIRPGRRETSNSWQQVKNKIFAIVSELPLPKSMIEKLKDIVPFLGQSILNWIRYHECILNSTAVDHIDKIAWTARGKIDHAQTAKNILEDKDTCLCDDHKYKLACTNCLEDEIAVLAPTVVNQYYLDSVQIHMHPMVYFWTAHITGDNTKLYNHYRAYNEHNISIYGYIIQLLINSNKRSYRTFNEVPIRYMWGKLSVEEKATNITSIVTEISNQELTYTLLSNLEFEKQQEVFKECSDAILLGIFNDWLWREYFLPIALHILDKMQPLAYVSILSHVNKEIKNSQEENTYLYNKYVFIFKQLWEEGCKIFQQDNGKTLVQCVFSLSWERDMDLIELILNDLNEEQKKSVIFENRGIDRCVDFIKKDQWELLERIIKYTISSEENINQLKEIMLKYRWYEISIHFLMYQALDKMDHFLSWACKSEEEMHGLRISLAHVKCDDELKSVVISNNKIDFTDLEKHFKWCAKGDLELINQFKAEIPMSYSKGFIRRLIREDKYELLDQCLSWCFSGNHKKMVQFKSNMYKVDNLAMIVGELTHFLIIKDNTLKRLDKFVDWLFSNQQEIQEFKMWLLYYSDEKYLININYFLFLNMLELADKFIKWCVTSVEEINQFKKMFMLSEDFIEIVKHYPEYIDWTSLIKWFNPSVELVEAFKKKCPVIEGQKKLYKLFEDYLENRNNLLESN